LSISISCDRCHTEFEPDKLNGLLSVSQLDDRGAVEGGCRIIGHICSDCCQELEDWFWKDNETKKATI